MDSNPQSKIKLTKNPNHNTNPMFFTIWHPNPKPNPIFFMENTTTPTKTQFFYPKTPYAQHQPNFFLKKDQNRGPTSNFTQISRKAKIGLKMKLSSKLIAAFAKLSPAQSQLKPSW